MSSSSCETALLIHMTVIIVNRHPSHHWDWWRRDRWPDPTRQRNIVIQSTTSSQSMYPVRTM